jgi:outer membrane protein TolC
VTDSRRLLSACLSWLVCFLPASGQQSVIAPIAPIAPDANALLRPYLPKIVPPVRLGNSDRLAALVKAGQLYLSLDDALALALENNIDLEIARYSPITAALRVTRAEAGGALPGVPSGSAQAGGVTSGQGVLGSQAAAGASSGGGARGGGGDGNASITQIGPVTQNLDPTIQVTTTFGHRTTPQPNSVQSRTPALVQDQSNFTTSWQQGLLSGGNFSLSMRGNNLTENSPTNILNPSTATSISLNFQHNLLQGFGRAMNGRNITIARMNAATSPITFKNQVIAVVLSVVNAYYALAAASEDVRAKRSSLETAQTFVKDSTRRYEVGALAGVDLIPAESQAAAARRDLLIAETSLRQNETRLKALLSRNGTGNPLLASARIIPTDRLSMPGKDDIPPLESLLATALANRGDIALRKSGLETTQVSLLGTRSAILPRVVGFASTSQQGLAGTAVPPAPGSNSRPADPYFVGGLGTALGQSIRRNFPSENGGVFFQAPLRNRQANADQAIDELQFRQAQLGVQKDINQVQVDLMNAVVAIEQARARYETAAKNVQLAQLLLDAEQKKFQLGAATSFSVLQQQRGLVAAQSAATATLVSYRNARTALSQALGTTLEDNRISIAEAQAGRLTR